MQRLELLREIAETINGAYEMETMLDRVLEKLLELTGLKTGWVFLLKPGERHYRFSAQANVPPALRTKAYEPMKTGACWCIDRYRDGRLHHAVNILTCKRIEDAIRLRLGDTDGISHHASIPLRAGEELFGILNVAAPGKTHFTEEELALLQSIAYQIGTASHRIRLFRTEKKRAELFARLGQATRALGALQALPGIETELVRQVGGQMGWPDLALYMREPDDAVYRAFYSDGDAEELSLIAPTSLEKQFLQPFGENRAKLWRDLAMPEGAGRESRRCVGVSPIRIKGKVWGVLVAGSPEPDALDETDLEVLEALAAHIALTVESITVNEKSRELTRWEERNRIARDLHDSVSQMLFSLSLNAKGVAMALPEEAPETTREALGQIQRLSQAAIGEMRAMIRQLRPAGLEEGLLTGLQRYGEQIGLSVSFQAGELVELPERLQTVFWRIGQEALNNVSKHAGTTYASMKLAHTEWEACLTVEDRGAGIRSEAKSGRFQYGMTTMRERAESVGGTLSVKSEPGQGTQIIVRLPI